MRCFIAIDIDDQLRKRIRKLQEDLRRQTNFSKSQAKWVRPELMHLTLKFLGDVRDDEITEVCGIVEEVVSQYTGFEIEFENVGVFGSPARVLWVGVRENEILLNLQSELERKLDGSGWPREKRKFAGHLTLCRIKNSTAGRKIGRLAEEYRGLNMGSVIVDSVCVYQSELTSNGPVYTVISRSVLSK